MRSLRIPDNKIYHAYLLEGENPENLREVVLQFARHVLKDEIRVAAASHPDLIFVKHEKPNVISVDDVRSQVGDTVDTRPYEAEYKIYVIEEAEKLNVQAQNALLKTMEEPPEYVVIILLTRNSSGFLETILSRVVELKDGEADAGRHFSEIAEEAWVKETIRALSSVGYQTTTDILNYIKLMHALGSAIQDVLALMELLLRDVLAYKSTADIKRIYAQEAAASIISMARDMGYAQIGQASEVLEEAFTKLRYHVNEDLVLENFLLTLKENVNKFD